MTVASMTKSIAARPPGPEAPVAEPRRRQLIEATITAIAEHGLSRTTLAKVAGIAGLTAGTVNFHFTSKEALLRETLKYLAEEFETALEAAVAAAGPDPARDLEALIDAYFDPTLGEPRKVAVWYAFFGEARARIDYMKLCGEREAAQFEAFLTLCRQIIEEGDRPMDAVAVTRGLTGLMEQLWQDVLSKPEAHDPAAAKRVCHAYLASVFPWRFELSSVARPAGAAVRGEIGPSSVPQATREEATVTLPAWIYDNAEFFELERQEIFLPAWHIVCHVSELPRPGSYVTLDLLGEHAFAVRGKDGEIRAFHNVCRHRAHAVVEGETGRCRGVLQCPYHGWTYDLNGALKAVAQDQTFQDLDKAKLGLKPIELEVFQGFVFIRFRGGGPGVAERFAPYAEELGHYRLPEMQPADGLWLGQTGVDWKNVWDNYLEGYHFATGHPGLFDLMGKDYEYEAGAGQTARLSHAFRDRPARTWSARHYQTLLPVAEHLPGRLRRRWSYFFLHPGMAFDIYPDKMDFFQILPTGPGKCILRGRSYALPDGRREMRAARYVNHRLNREVQNEDNRLIASVQKGLASSSYDVGVISDTEIILRAFQGWVREALPVAGLATPPLPGTVAARNRTLAADAISASRR